MIKLHIHKNAQPSFEELLDIVRGLRYKVKICVEAGNQFLMDLVRRVVDAARAHIGVMG